MQFSFFCASKGGYKKVSYPVAAPLGLANNRVVIRRQPSGFHLGLNAHDRGVVVCCYPTGSYFRLDVHGSSLPFLRI